MKVTHFNTQYNAPTCALIYFSLIKRSKLWLVLVLIVRTDNNQISSMIGYGTLPSWSNICGTCCDKITIMFLVESKRAFQMKKYQNIYKNRKHLVK